MAISPQQLTIYLYSAHRAVIFAIAQLSCYSRAYFINTGMFYLKVLRYRNALTLKWMKLHIQIC